MAGGNPRLGRQQDDFYPTPRDVTEGLLAVWRPESAVVWEPACGINAMVYPLEAAGYRVIATDLVDRGYGETPVDFLTTTERRADCIVTNPPFELAVPFIEHAFALGVTELALVLKSTFWQAKKRYPLWQKHPPSLVLPLLWRADFMGLGAPTMDCSWFVWEAARGTAGECRYRPLPRLERPRANARKRAA